MREQLTQGMHEDCLSFEQDLFHEIHTRKTDDDNVMRNQHG